MASSCKNTNTPSPSNELGISYEYRPPAHRHTHQCGEHPKRRTAHAVERACPLMEGRRVRDGDGRLAGQLRVPRGYSAEEGREHRTDFAHACYYAGEVA